MYFLIFYAIAFHYGFVSETFRCGVLGVYRQRDFFFSPVLFPPFSVRPIFHVDLKVCTLIISNNDPAGTGRTTFERIPLLIHTTNVLYNYTGPENDVSNKVYQLCKIIIDED